MEYRKFKTGDETYLLSDPEEIFDQTSWGRTYDGNVNPCRESSFAFVEKVVLEISKMFEDAGVWNSENPPYFHVGGDEVPGYAWTDTPLCDAFYQENNGVNSKEDLLSYFIIRYSQIVDNIGFKVIAWEDSFIKNGEPIPLNELGNGTSDASSQFAIRLKKN